MCEQNLAALLAELIRINQNGPTDSAKINERNQNRSNHSTQLKARDQNRATNSEELQPKAPQPEPCDDLRIARTIAVVL